MFATAGARLSGRGLSWAELPDAGEVQALGEEFGDASQGGEVVLAVAAGAAGGSPWFQESAAFVEAEVLLACADEFCCYGDGVHAVGVGVLSGHGVFFPVVPGSAGVCCVWCAPCTSVPVML